MKPFVYFRMHTCTCYCIFGDNFPKMSPKLMLNHLNVGFQSSDDITVWRRDFCSRWTDNRKKVAPTMPRMTTPEIRALVTGFIGWELAGDAEKWRFESRHLKGHNCSYEHHFTWVRFHPFFWSSLLMCTVIQPISINYGCDNSYAHLPSWELLTGFSSESMIWQRFVNIFLILRMH